MCVDKLCVDTLYVDILYVINVVCVCVCVTKLRGVDKLCV